MRNDSGEERRRKPPTVITKDADEVRMQSEERERNYFRYPADGGAVITKINGPSCGTEEEKLGPESSSQRTTPGYLPEMDYPSKHYIIEELKFQRDKK